MSPDLINGFFELFATFFICLHIRRTLKDKSVKGVSIVATVFFFAWGVWNIYFYPSQKLWWSFAGGLLVAIANLVWVVLMVVYHRRETKKCLQDSENR